MQLIRAGHNKPILVSRKLTTKIQDLESPGMGIGLERSGKLFKQFLQDQIIELHEGDTLVLFTDGLTEAALVTPDDDTDFQNVEP